MVMLKSVNGDDPQAAVISGALSAEIAEKFGPAGAAPLVVLAHAGAELVGGVIGLLHWRWLYVRQLWVADGWRARGVGSDLLARAEEKARDAGCVGLYIDTFDLDVARYYERRGFVAAGRIPDFPPGFARTFLYKRV